MITADALLRHAAWIAERDRDTRWRPAGAWLEQHSAEHRTGSCPHADDCPGLRLARTLLYGPTPDSPAELTEDT